MRGQHLITLDQINTCGNGTISQLKGNDDFINRLTDKGIAIGSEVEVLLNRESRPLLTLIEDTRISLDRSDAEKIFVEMEFAPK